MQVNSLRGLLSLSLDAIPVRCPISLMVNMHTAFIVMAMTYGVYDSDLELMNRLEKSARLLRQAVSEQQLDVAQVAPVLAKFFIASLKSLVGEEQYGKITKGCVANATSENSSDTEKLKALPAMSLTYMRLCNLMASTFLALGSAEYARNAFLLWTNASGISKQNSKLLGYLNTNTVGYVASVLGVIMTSFSRPNDNLDEATKLFRLATKVLSEHFLKYFGGILFHLYFFLGGIHRLSVVLLS
jgi:hypothetical protein